MKIKELIETHLLTTLPNGHIKLESQRLHKLWFEKRRLLDLYVEHAVVLNSPKELSKLLHGLIKPAKMYNFTGICDGCRKETTFISVGRGFKNCCSKSCTQTKTKNTNLTLYGNEFYRNLDKMKATKLERYNNPFYLNPKQIEKTMLRKYGVRNIMQTGLIEIGYKWKDYELPSGTVIKIQGYENFLLDELLETYSERGIKTSRKDMPEFWYELDGVKRRYFPDAYIPETNTIYEVKSEYTMKCNKQMNALKFQSVIAAGFNFALKIYNPDGSPIIS